MDLISEMRELLVEPAIVTEARALARESGVELPERLNEGDVYALVEAIEELEEGLLRKGASLLWKGLKFKAKVVAAPFIIPALLPAVATYKLAKKLIGGFKKARNEGGSGELLRADEPFTIGDVAFHPRGSGRWHAMLPGRYEMFLRYNGVKGVFTAEVEGYPLGTWDEDALGNAIQTALTLVHSMDQDDRLGSLGEEP